MWACRISENLGKGAECAPFLACMGDLFYIGCKDEGLCLGEEGIVYDNVLFPYDDKWFHIQEPMLLVRFFEKMEYAAQF